MIPRGYDDVDEDRSSSVISKGVKSVRTINRVRFATSKEECQWSGDKEVTLNPGGDSSRD